MHALIVYNPRSGRGRAARYADQASHVLRKAGHTIEKVVIERDRSDRVLGKRLDNAGALVVCGGDGTVRWIARAAELSGVPVYQLPTGTENLFAREFAMTPRMDRMLAAIEAGASRAVDVGVCNGRRFLIMASVGLDAGVIHRLAAARNGAITHLSYTVPILKETFMPRVGPVRVQVDGQTILDGERGVAIVCNSHHYAARLNPGRDARIDDGLLDLVFMPGSTTLGIARWGLLARLGMHVNGTHDTVKSLQDNSQRNGVVYVRGRHFVIEGDPGGCPVQFDGEAFTDGCELGKGPGRLEVGIEPGAIRVLDPVGVTAPTRTA